MRKSNNAAAANAANKGGDAKGDDHSEEDEDDEGSEGAAPSTSTSNRNSLTINNGMKSPTLFSMDTDKTPTTNSLLSQAQAARPNFQAQATIRRHNLATGNENHPAGQQVQNAQQSSPAFLGAAPQQAHTVRDLPNFPDIEEAVGTDSSSPQGMVAREVWRWFEDHLNALLESVRSFRFDQFELNLRTFWTSLSGDHREVVHAPAVAGLMAKADAMVYNVSCSI